MIGVMCIKTNGTPSGLNMHGFLPSWHQLQTRTRPPKNILEISYWLHMHRNTFYDALVFFALRERGNYAINKECSLLFLFGVRWRVYWRVRWRGCWSVVSSMCVSRSVSSICVTSVSSITVGRSVSSITVGRAVSSITEVFLIFVSFHLRKKGENVDNDKVVNFK
jgi:hypothetical protein